MLDSGNDVFNYGRFFRVLVLHLFFLDHRVGKVGWAHTILDCLVAIFSRHCCCSLQL